MSNILKGILNETSPHDYDSDWDYQDAVARSGKSRSSYRSQEDDTFDADVAYSRKMYQLGQQQKAAKEKAQRDSDHDRIATGTNEGLDDPWGDQGNFAGGKPVNLGGVSIKNIQIGDTVKYLGQPSQVVAMSKDRKYSRIKISKGMGTVTQDVLTSDLQQLGRGTAIEENDNTRMRMNDYYDLADAIQEKLRQAIQLGNKELIQKLNKERDDLDARVKQYGLMPEDVAEGSKKEEEYGPEWDEKVKRIGQMAKEGPRKTVWDPVKRVYKTVPVKQSGIKQGINELSPGATGPKGPKDYGQPNSSRYIGGNKFVVGTTNNYVLTATIDKWGLEWDEDDEIWFLDSPGAAHIADASEGEIELPPPREQRNQIHDLVTDYLNAKNLADLQKVAAYYGHGNDGEMATNEGIEAPRFNSKQEVINHFVKNGKSAAAGAAAWERGWRGSSPKRPIELKKPPQRSYHDEIDDKRYSATFENLGDQLKSTSLDALVQAKLAIERQREADIEAWKQDFQKNTAQKAQQQLTRTFQPIPVAQSGEKYSVLKDRLKQLNIAEPMLKKISKLITAIKTEYPLVAKKMDDIDSQLLQQVKDGADPRDNYQSLISSLKELYTDLPKKYPRAIKVKKNRAVTESPKRIDYDSDTYDNPKMGREYGKANLFVDPGSTEFPKERHVGDPEAEVGRPKRLTGLSKALPADAFGRTTGKIPASARPTSKQDPFREVDEEKQRLDPSCWKGYKKQGTKMKGDKPVKETKSHILAGLQQVDEGWKEKLGAAALAGSMALGAGSAQGRVTYDADGNQVGGMKPTATVQAEPAPSPSPSTTTIPGQGLVRAERADRQAGTVTVDGQEYKMIMLEPGGIRPRGGQQIVIPQAVMGERGMGNYMAILAGGRVFVLPRNE
jgi:hypothetical protein